MPSVALRSVLLCLHLQKHVELLADSKILSFAKWQRRPTSVNCMLCKHRTAGDALTSKPKILILIPWTFQAEARTKGWQAFIFTNTDKVSISYRNTIRVWLKGVYLYVKNGKESSLVLSPEAQCRRWAQAVWSCSPKVKFLVHSWVTWDSIFAQGLYC